MIGASALAALQRNTDHLRNICILAHVDHGKTTLADSLIASNGLISSKQAGKIRFLDSLAEEQEREITIKSSSISLLFNYQGPDAAAPEQYLINLIDSPGHVDFSSEVSTAVRLCDGALVLVDLVEGVQVQTHTVLRQAWTERVKCVLVLNKLDRLVLELKWTPADAYRRMRQIIDEVNAYISALFTEEQLAETSREGREHMDDEIDDSELYFSPEKGNVIFGSAIDGFAFSTHQFAEFYAAKLGMKRDVLEKTLWGDFFYNSKKKSLHRTDQGGTLRPMFVQFVLENVWAVYGAFMDQPDDLTRGQRIADRLGLTVPPRELNAKDRRFALQSVLSRWLPLSQAALSAVVTCLPSPRAAQAKRMPFVWPALFPGAVVPAGAGFLRARAVQLAAGDGAGPERCRADLAEMRRSVLACDRHATVTSVFVSKVVSADPDAIDGAEAMRRTAARVLLTRAGVADAGTAAAAAADVATEAAAATDGAAAAGADAAGAGAAADSGTERAGAGSDTDDALLVQPRDDRTRLFVAFARVFGGTLRVGDRVQILGPRYDPARPARYRHVLVVRQLYMMMGRGLDPIDEAPAGTVCGIGGVHESILKTATVSSSTCCPPLNVIAAHAKPIIRVAVEPKNPLELPRLVRGLRLLNYADPAVDVQLLETGEHIIAACGEVHLEHCLRDLRERYAAIELIVSPPLIPFRETIVARPDGKPVERSTPSRLFTFRMRAVPMPDTLSEWLEAHVKQLMPLFGLEESAGPAPGADELRHTVEALRQALAAAGPWWLEQMPNIVSVGPRRIGANLLLSPLPALSSLSPLRRVTDAECGAMVAPAAAAAAAAALAPGQPDDSAAAEPSAEHAELRDVAHAVVTGFQAATSSGPMAEEPLMGVCFVLEEVAVGGPEARAGALAYGPVSGQVITAVREGLRSAMMAAAPRLVEAFFELSLDVSSDVLGLVYSVLRRRRATVLNEAMREGTTLFTISALMPVTESFGFGDELRTQASGAASPQMVFRCWRTLNEDPYWVPRTQEELELLGEKADAPVYARQLLNDLRRRKGLFVEEKIVESAEKQRNLSRNK